MISLVCDYNSIKSLNTLPKLGKLTTLSMSYNVLGDIQGVLDSLSKNCPALEHLNLMKNPCNPVFSNEYLYQEFRAKFAIWMPNLKTLDGTDFKDDQDMINKMKSGELNKKVASNKLESIPEEGSGGKAAFPQGIDKTIKAQAGTTAFSYNQKAHKKYSSHRSLVDRILKSHSEGNRFIRNEDL